MKPGEKFETDAVAYLNRHYSYGGKIIFLGGDTSDSTKSDIEVVISGRTAFCMEAKDAAAQSGQFVLFPNEQTRQFEFSLRNQSAPNEMTGIIIDYMNKNFERYNDAGTRGKSIDIDNSVFYKWIIDYYENKNVKFFITKKSSFIIAPIHKFPYYFDVYATYRIKKSGSSSPSKKDIENIKRMIKNLYPTVEFTLIENKLFADIKNPLSTQHFSLGKYTYILSERNAHIYEVRRLSNTNNMNVIFSINVKQEQVTEDLLLFKKDLGLG